MRAPHVLSFLIFTTAAFAYAVHASPVPKNHCEDPSEWNLHTYSLLTSVPKLKGDNLFRGMAGRTHGGGFDPGNPSLSPHGNYVGGLIDGNLAGDCNGDTLAGDFDEHSEYAFGGAWLMTNSGDGVTGGSVACYGEAAHHPAYGPITVVDTVWGTAMAFIVASDYDNLVPPTSTTEPNCGDFETDESTTCVGSCTVTFGAGLDGGYIVYVGDPLTGSVGEMGQVTSP